MEDGSALAFFQFADPEMYALTQTDKPPKMGRHYHIAFKAEPETYDELKRRLETAGEPYRESNHGYCESIYVSSPGGLIVEFTQDPEDAGAPPDRAPRAGVARCESAGSHQPRKAGAIGKAQPSAPGPRACPASSRAGRRYRRESSRIAPQRASGS
jgi:hypothetical protein